MDFQIDTDNQEFQEALQLISFTRQSVFLTGKAGTGKSTFLKYICKTTKKKFVVLAPTGIAAINAGGVTLSVGKVHETGARESQQDCFAVLPEELWPEKVVWAAAVMASGSGYVRNNTAMCYVSTVGETGFQQGAAVSGARNCGSTSWPVRPSFVVS